jgi:WD40 repeat protein
MAKQWYYAKEGVEVGPVSAPELRDLAAKGHLLPADHVWAEGQKDWIAARKVRGLFGDRPRPDPRSNSHPKPAASIPVNVPDRSTKTNENDRGNSPFAFDETGPSPDEVPQRFTAGAKGRGLPRAHLWVIGSAVASVLVAIAALVGIFGRKSSDEVLRVEVESGSRPAVAFSPDGRTVQLARSIIEPIFAAWDIHTGNVERAVKGPPVFSGGEGCSNLCVAFSADHRCLLFGSTCNNIPGPTHVENVVRIWDIIEGKESGRLKGHDAAEAVGVIFAVATSADGRSVLSCTMGNRDSEAVLWDLPSRQAIRRVGPTARVAYTCAALSADGSLGLIGGWFSEAADSLVSRVVIIPRDAGSKIRHADFDQRDAVQAVAIAPNGRHALIGGKTIRLIDLGTMKEIRQMSGHTSGVTTLAISADGHRAVSGSHDQTVRVWDIATGRQLRCFNGHKDAVWGVAVSPDGRYAASISSDSTLRVWKMPE